MEEVSIYCPHCNKHTALSEAQTEYREGVNRIRCYTKAAWKRSSDQEWWIGICNSCRWPVLVLNQGVLVYPHPLPSPTDPNIPQEIARDLDEAKLCFSVGCYRACAVMARRCVESACVVRGATGDKLVQKIAKLASDGVITKGIQDWATVVRWIGNDAAHHNEDEVTKADADDCLHLAEQFLHILFVTPAVAEARKAARGK